MMTVMVLALLGKEGDGQRRNSSAHDREEIIRITGCAVFVTLAYNEALKMSVLMADFLVSLLLRKCIDEDVI